MKHLLILFKSCFICYFSPTSGLIGVKQRTAEIGRLVKGLHANRPENRAEQLSLWWKSLNGGLENHIVVAKEAS